MVPGARVAAAIDILDEWLSGADRVDMILRRWARANRYAGSKDRRAIADMVYECLRQKRSLSWRSAAAGGRAMLHGLALRNGWDASAIFSGARFHPAPLTPQETANDRPPPSDAIRLDIPDWLEPQLRASLGDGFERDLSLCAERAPVDIRANISRIDPDRLLKRLATEGVEATPIPDTPAGLRCQPGASILATAAFQDGLCEVQDAASQLAARKALTAPGSRILDYCAGAGGKALAIYDQNLGQCKVDAHDVAPQRMKDLPERSKRAKAEIGLKSTAELDAQGACYDIVFVDAPCSGSGTWRRDVEAKWRLDQNRLNTLVSVQREAAQRAATYVKPGGLLIYATCSVLNCENEDQVDWLAANSPNLELLGRTRTPVGRPGDGFFSSKLKIAGQISCNTC